MDRPYRLEPAQAYIRAHLDDPGLCPKAVARQVGMTVDALQGLFRRRTGMSAWRWILIQRLEGVGRDLIDPAKSQVTAQEVATRWGFTAKKPFLFRFRQRYGMTPTQYRRQCSTSPGGRS